MHSKLPLCPIKILILKTDIYRTIFHCIFHQEKKKHIKWFHLTLLRQKKFKIRILVEQVIRQVKTFKILANELPISLIRHIDDILVMCCALVNLKPSVFRD